MRRSPQSMTACKPVQAQDKEQGTGDRGQRTGGGGGQGDGVNEERHMPLMNPACYIFVRKNHRSRSGAASTRRHIKCHPRPLKGGARKRLPRTGRPSPRNGTRESSQKAYWRERSRNRPAFVPPFLWFLSPPTLSAARVSFLFFWR